MLIKHTRVPLSCDTIWSIHPMLDTRTVHIVLRIHHLLLLFNNNTNSLLLRRLLWDWLVASQERWVCTKLPMYVLSTFLLPFHNCRTTLRYRGRDTHRKVEIRRVPSERNVESNLWGALRFLNIAPQIFDFSFFFIYLKLCEGNEESWRLHTNCYDNRLYIWIMLQEFVCGNSYLL